MNRYPSQQPFTGNSTIRILVLLLVLCFGLGATVASVSSQELDESPENLQTTSNKKFRKDQSHPIRLGTSGGNVEDVTPLQCCDGTLGALVEKNGVQYILSNNHVLARSNKAKKGEAIIQPGLGDQRPICEPLDPGADTVAHLSARKKVKFGANKTNKIDAAIAEVVPGAVRPNGEIIGIGMPGSNPIKPYLGMKVKKSGRTTGLTRGFISVVNGMAQVEYPKKCGSETVNVARFRDLFYVTGNNGKPFIKGGDSGSMVYEDRNNCPSPVGLIFAGNEEYAAASPAATVQKIVSKLDPKGPMHFVGCNSTSFGTTSASSGESSTGGSDTLFGSSAVSRPLIDERQVELATDAMRNRREDLFQIRGVQGFGIGITLYGPIEPAIYVFSTETPDEIRKHLPETIDGYRVEVFKTDSFVAY